MYYDGQGNKFFFGKGDKVAKAYCPKCKKRLDQTLSSFECLATWDKEQEYYAPESECNLVKRCPVCGTITAEKERGIQRRPKMAMKEKAGKRKPSYSKNRPRVSHPG